MHDSTRQSVARINAWHNSLQHKLEPCLPVVRNLFGYDAKYRRINSQRLSRRDRSEIAIATAVPRIMDKAPACQESKRHFPVVPGFKAYEAITVPDRDM